MEDIYNHNKEVNDGYMTCDLSNFKNICRRIEEELNKASTDLEICVDEMCSLTSIYRDATDVDYSKYRINTGNVYDRKFEIPTSNRVDSKTLVTNDFNRAKSQIEAFFIDNFHDGDFKVTKRVLELPYWCIDWEYYNRNPNRFVEICRKTDEEQGLDEAKPNVAMCYKNDYGALDVYMSRYNQRAYIKFDSVSNSKQAVGDLETEYREYNDDDTFWVDVPFSC